MILRLLLIMLIPFSVHSLEFQPRGEILYIWGGYDEGDYDAFLTIMELNDIKTVELGDSEGGFISEAFPIGLYIRDNKIDTIIEDGAECVSSCAMVWSAGDSKMILGSGVAKFHSPYVPTEGIVELIDSKCLEESLEVEETVETCVDYNENQVIDGVRYMTREAIQKGVKYMIDINAPSRWIVEMLGQSPEDFFNITNADRKEYE